MSHRCRGAGPPPGREGTRLRAACGRSDRRLPRLIHTVKPITITRSITSGSRARTARGANSGHRTDMRNTQRGCHGDADDVADKEGNGRLHQVAGRQLACDEQQDAQQRCRCGGGRSAGSQQHENVAHMAEADVEAQLPPRDGCRRGKRCRYESSHTDDHGPLPARCAARRARQSRRRRTTRARTAAPLSTRTAKATPRPGFQGVTGTPLYSWMKLTHSSPT